MTAPTDVSISGGDAIRLGEFVKLAGAAGSGGEAKHLVQAGLVQVNGAVDAHRGRKVKPGDVVAVAGRGTFVVVA